MPYLVTPVHVCSPVGTANTKRKVEHAEAINVVN